jgi:hypothetical protein
MWLPDRGSGERQVVQSRSLTSRLTPHLILKLALLSKIGDFEAEGQYQGFIDQALIDSSVTSNLRLAHRVEVLMRWNDERGKHHREKLPSAR